MTTFDRNGVPVMKHNRLWLGAVAIGAMIALLSVGRAAHTQSDPLPSWNDGPAKQAIVDFVRATTEKDSPQFVSPAERIATFDQDGTLWVEHPMYTQVMYCLDRVGALTEKDPKLKNVEPFKTVLSGDSEAIAKLPMKDIEKMPDTKVGAFPQALYDRAQKDGWTVISMKNDWRRIFGFEK
jgi:hypothetical protein